MARHQPDIDDIHLRTGSLHALLQCVYMVYSELDHVRADGSRIGELDQLGYLIILARDEAQRIDAAFDNPA